MKHVQVQDAYLKVYFENWIRLEPNSHISQVQELKHPQRATNEEQAQRATMRNGVHRDNGITVPHLRVREFGEMERAGLK